MQNIQRCGDVRCWVSIRSTFSSVFWTRLLLSVSRCIHEWQSWWHNSRTLNWVQPYGALTPPCSVWFAGTVLLSHFVVGSLALMFGVQFWILPWTPSVHWRGTHCLDLFGCIWAVYLCDALPMLYRLWMLQTVRFYFLRRTSSCIRNDRWGRLRCKCIRRYLHLTFHLSQNEPNQAHVLLLTLKVEKGGIWIFLFHNRHILLMAAVIFGLGCRSFLSVGHKLLHSLRVPITDARDCFGIC